MSAIKKKRGVLWEHTHSWAQTWRKSRHEWRGTVRKKGQHDLRPGPGGARPPWGHRGQNGWRRKYKGELRVGEISRQGPCWGFWTLLKLQCQLMEKFLWASWLFKEGTASQASGMSNQVNGTQFTMSENIKKNRRGKSRARIWFLTRWIWESCGTWTWRGQVGS